MLFNKYSKFLTYTYQANGIIVELSSKVRRYRMELWCAELPNLVGQEPLFAEARELKNVCLPKGWR